jgi:D-ribose pyranase
MKKMGILNQPISSVIAGLGHTDRLVISDAGLPIPAHVQKIDLALSEGIPSFLDTLETILKEMQVESAIIASEISEYNPKVELAIVATLQDIPITKVPHEQLKHETRSATAIIRTGEFSPYANIILISGVVF